MKNQSTLFVLICSFIFFSCNSPSSKTSVQPPVVQKRNDLPNMVIKTLDESTVNIRTLKGNIVLILFQPDCDHCQREAKEIRENLEAFKSYSLYFISADQLMAVTEFGEEFDLLGKSNVYFALTTVDNVINSFGSIPAPSVYIYTDQKLVQKFNGEVTIEKILQAI